MRTKRKKTTATTADTLTTRQKHLFQAIKASYGYKYPTNKVGVKSVKGGLVVKSFFFFSSLEAP